MAEIEKVRDMMISARMKANKLLLKHADKYFGDDLSAAQPIARMYLEKLRQSAGVKNGPQR